MKTMSDVFAIAGEVLEILTSRTPIPDERRRKLSDLNSRLQNQIAHDRNLPRTAGALRRLGGQIVISRAAEEIFDNLRRELDNKEAPAA